MIPSTAENFDQIFEVYTSDGYGVTSGAKRFDIYGKLSEIRGSETVEGSQEVAKDTRLLTTWYESDIIESDVIKDFDGLAWDIERLQVVGRNLGLRLTITKRDNQTA